MRWFVLLAGLLILLGLALVGYITMVWIAFANEPTLTSAQSDVFEVAKWMTRNGMIMLGSFFFGWLAGQVR